jgi:RsiW-degrading membrane proteinase PrsW (M82 family)
VGEIIDWSLALVPVLVLTAGFIWLDVFKLVSFRETVGLLLVGGASAIVAYPLSGYFLDTLPIGFSNYSRFAAPWIEEALKAVVIIGLFRINRIGLTLDALIMGFAVGAGFSVVENVLYLVRFPKLPPSVWIVRGLGTAVMHGTTAAILAAIAHRLAVRELHHEASDFHFRLWWFVPGYLAAVAIHTLFNQFPTQPLLAMLVTAVVAPLALMVILRFGTTKARQWLGDEEAAHQALLEKLEAGAFPDKPGWRRINEMVERAGPQTGALIREYVIVLTRLILAEEEVLLKQSEEAHRVETDGRVLFKRFQDLRRELGSVTIHAVTSLLPFARSDYWEVWELHHHLTHSGDVGSPTRQAIEPHATPATPHED